MNNKKTAFDTIIFVIDCILTICWLVFAIRNLWVGIYTHDAYHLVLAILEYWVIQSGVKDIKKYLDIKD